MNLGLFFFSFIMSKYKSYVKMVLLPGGMYSGVYNTLYLLFLLNDLIIMLIQLH